MIQIKEKDNCCGCTACYSICPQKAITMVEDNEGFKYPKIDLNRCTDCKLCEKVCPILNQSKQESLKKAKIIRTKDNKDLSQSTSGGFFTPISEYVIKNQGFVFGVIFDNKKIIHYCTNNVNEIEKFRGSKYVQSELNESFIKVKELLDKGKLVLFSGTPCQIEGLKNYLRKDYDNLITIDVICHGTPSPLLFKFYINYMEKKYNSKIKKINFRNKTYGYHVGTMKIEFENGKVYYGSARTDYMLKAFFKEISSRPACYSCKFKTKNHISDFTIYDCWSASKINTNINDDDKGFTNLIINTDKGEKIFELIKKEYQIFESDFNKAIELDGIMVENVAHKHDKRNEFYDYLNQYGLEKTIEKYIPISKKDKIIEKSKGIFHKLGLIVFIKKIKNLKKKIKNNHN